MVANARKTESFYSDFTLLPCTTYTLKNTIQLSASQCSLLYFLFKVPSIFANSVFVPQAQVCLLKIVFCAAYNLHILHLLFSPSSPSQSSK